MRIDVLPRLICWSDGPDARCGRQVLALELEGEADALPAVDRLAGASGGLEFPLLDGLEGRLAEGVVRGVLDDRRAAAGAVGEDRHFDEHAPLKAPAAHDRGVLGREVDVVDGDG